MQFIIHLLPSELLLLHNTGVFHYQKLPMLFFVLKLALFPVILILVLFCIYRIISKRPRIHRQLRTAIFIVTTLFILAGILVYPGVTSKLYFAIGYDRYLNNKDTEACNYYFKSLNTDSSFIWPLSELISIYKENPENTVLLKQIAEETDTLNNDDLFAQVGQLYEDNKNYTESLIYYEKARKLNPEIRYTVSIIRNLIVLRDYAGAESQLPKDLPDKYGNEFKNEILFCSSLIDFHKGHYAEAKLKIEELINSDAINPGYYIHKARILGKLGDETNALKMLSKALSLKRELPEAYFEKARIYYSIKDYDNTKKALHKTLYYDNKNSLAYVMLQMVIAEQWMPIESLTYDNNAKIVINDGKDKFQLTKGSSINFTAVFSDVAELDRFKIGILEPYGFGLESKLIKTDKSRSQDGNQSLHAIFNIKALRASKINLNHPWILNVVFVDIGKGTYCDNKLFVMVNRRQNEEGRILLVITEDHEQTGDFPHADDTPDTPDIDPYEINVDLVQKGLFADQLADKYGIKWSHIIDIGSSFLRLKWIQNGKHGNQWDTVWDNMSSYLKQSILTGHDIQLHIHAYGIPDNKLFRQYFNADKNKILFKDNIVRPEIASGIHGAWSENFTKLGNYNEPNSRIGSIFKGIQSLEGELHETDPSYRTIFFRAGEYEFGKGKQSVSKSILALSQNKILAGSDTIEGSPFRRDFKFFNRVGTNVYFTKRSNIHERADSLLDMGVLEFLPVPKINAHSYITPITDWKHVKYNYDQCLSGDRIKNDIFILMEMYHLNNVNWAHKWDRFDTDYEDWARMNNHFKYIKKNCPKMESVTISDAIKAYIDRYSPDIIALRTNEKKLTEKLYSYDIEVYGKDIEVSDLRPHYTSVKPPSYFIGKIDKVELLKNNTILKKWINNINYRELEFEIIDRAGYSLRVYLM